MKIRVVDFETTGLPEDEVKGVCEMAFTDVDVETMTLSPTISYRVNPGHPIPPKYRAVHHISDADVAYCVSPQDAFDHLEYEMNSEDFYCAHHAAFEQVFFQGKNPWICTLNVSKHLFPDFEGYKLHEIRYMIDLDTKTKMVFGKTLPPHAAGPDTYVCANLVKFMLGIGMKPETMFELTNRPVLLKKVNFGKHKGSLWKDLPQDYLRWIIEKSEMGKEEKYTATHYLAR